MHVHSALLPGSPIRYVPLSIHMPAHYKELRLRQAQCASHQSWWPCENQVSTSATPPKERPAPTVISLGPCDLPSTVDLQEELLAAIDAPLTIEPIPPLLSQTRSMQPPTYPHPQVKTSSTHPIKYVFLAIDSQQS